MTTHPARSPLAGPIRPKADDARSVGPQPALPFVQMLIDVRSLAHPSEIVFAPGGALRRVMVAATRAAVQAILKLVAWRSRARERQQLLSLDDRTLRDLGLTRQDIQRL